MSLKKRIPLILSIVAIISFIGAVLILSLALPKADATYKKVLEIVISCLMIALSFLCGSYLWMTRDVEQNFFLFDCAKKKNIPVENLNFAIVNERMGVYLSKVGVSTEQLWQEDYLERERILGYRRVYRPLLAYKMLYDLADKNIATYWDLLINVKPAILDSLCSALEQGGETQMVRAFRFIMDNYRNNPEKIKDFICCNTRYIRGRMLGYVKKYIELFY